ncbi:hypothetical protein AB205_0210310 [Aquarana catesbeiana]|uniref:Uncharacterized protein n=1 Tax=Aquarana catesbeiana TaxID=8400 RepID=A0A2G9S1X6_AQUCT|nr:hypothetical protein AB205_0210310 [Aquarana catesbeiana]
MLYIHCACVKLRPRRPPLTFFLEYSPPLLFLRNGRRHGRDTAEMVEMVDILKRADYDGKYGPYLNPNVRKAKIMTKVVKSLRRNFGIRRSKEQLRKRWSDLKLREHDQYRRIKKVHLKSDVQVVLPKLSHFTSDSAQELIQEIMFCSRDLDLIEQLNKD